VSIKQELAGPYNPTSSRAGLVGDQIFVARIDNLRKKSFLLLNDPSVEIILPPKSIIHFDEGVSLPNDPEAHMSSGLCEWPPCDALIGKDEIRGAIDTVLTFKSSPCPWPIWIFWVCAGQVARIVKITDG